MAGPGAARPGASDTMLRYGQVLVRSSSIYAVGVGILVPLGLISLAISTRYLSPAEFGRLTVLFAAASILTVIAGIGVLQGTLMVAYRGGADDEDGADDLTSEDVGELPELTSAERKRIFTSGVLIAAGMAAALTVPLALLAGPVASLLLGSDDYARAVRWMLASVWAGSVWRMVHQVWRYERRAPIWVAFQAFRPVLVLAGSAWALANGHGIEGVLAATAIGTVITSAISVAASRRNYVLAPRLADFGKIMRPGMRFAPIVIASLTQGPVAVLVVAALASAETVGIFQVAAKLAVVPAYFGDGVLIGWPALLRGPIGRAAMAHRGRAGHGAFIFTLMAMTMLALLVLLSLSIDVVIHIAADDYAGAADLVPLLAAGAISHVLFRAVYRTSRFPYRRTWYVVLHFLYILPYAVTIALLAPLQASWAVAAGQVVANAMVIGVMVWLAIHRGTDPVPYPWGRLALAAVVGAACVLAVDLSGTDDLARAGVSVAAVVAFPIGLVAVGALPRREARATLGLLGALLPRRRTSRARIGRRLQAMNARERSTFVAVAWGGRTAAEVATHEGVPVDVVHARLARALRAFAELSRDGGPADVEIGRYLLHTGTTLERDDLAMHLGGRGIDPYVLHRLEVALADARRSRRSGLRVLEPLDPAAVHFLAPVA